MRWELSADPLIKVESTRGPTPRSASRGLSKDGFEGRQKGGKCQDTSGDPLYLQAVGEGRNTRPRTRRKRKRGRLRQILLRSLVGRIKVQSQRMKLEQPEMEGGGIGQFIRGVHRQPRDKKTIKELLPSDKCRPYARGSELASSKRSRGENRKGQFKATTNHSFAAVRDPRKRTALPFHGMVFPG